MSETNEQNSPWRWFPIASLGALGLIVVVNMVMIYYALHTFPGESVHGGFETSNNYEQVLDHAAQQAALGWQIDAKTDGGRVLLHAVGRDGQPLANAMATATARRPLGPPMPTEIIFDSEAGGNFRAEAALPQPGQWDVQIQVTSGNEQFVSTRRVMVK